MLDTTTPAAAADTPSNTITIEFPVSDQLCGDILCAALEGGIGYWAAADKIQRSERDKDGNWSYTSAELHDAEGGDFEPEVIDYAGIRRGLQRLISGQVKVRSDLMGAIVRGVTEDDGGHIDADCADCIVQAALFNELVYG